MQISDEGLRLIKSFEGYHKRLADGRCLTYRCPANVLTIGYGCTEGIKDGMIWTEQEAEEALRREITKHESAVNRLATVDLNQNEFDALVSFSYNCGIGALSESTLLEKLNKGDRVGAAKQFEKWVTAKGRTLPGLVTRRKREAVLFMKPVEAPEAPYMPQTVGKDPETSTKAVVAVTGTTAIGGAAGFIPVPPSVDAVGAWTTHGDKVAALGAWVKVNPFLTMLCLFWALVLIFYPKLTKRFPWLPFS